MIFKTSKTARLPIFILKIGKPFLQTNVNYVRGGIQIEINILINVIANVSNKCIYYAKF